MTRERLLEATVAVIGEAGWGGVTTRAVAERAGVNQGLVHYHFASITDLLIAASTSFTRALLHQTAEELATKDVSGGLDWLLGELARYTGDDPASRTFAEALLAAGRLPQLRAELAAVLTAFRATVADWLRDHGHNHEADATALVLAATLDGLVLHRTLQPDLDPTELREPLRRMLDLTTPPTGGT